MKSDALYVEGQLVDLPPGFKFALTITALDLGALDTRDVDFTNTVKLQWTPTNQVTFGFAWNQKSGSRIPYRKLTARLLQEGIETMPDGRCWVKTADESGVTIAIYENVINVFDAIAGRKLNELAHIAISAWTAAGIDGHRLNTDGLIAAVLNWGKSGAIFQLDYFLPCWFYHNFVTESFKLTGLLLSGNILTDAKFKDLVIPYSRPQWEYPLGQSELYQLTAPLAFYSLNLGYNFTVDGTTLFQGINGSLGGGTTDKWQLVGSELELKDSGHGTTRWLTLLATAPPNAALWISAWNPGDQIQVILEIYHPLDPSYTYQWAYLAQEATFGAAPVDAVMGIVGAQTQLITISDGARIRLYVDNIGSSIGVTHTTGIGAEGDLGLSAVSTTTIDRNGVTWMQLVPDMLMSEIIKDFTVRFGVVYKQVAGTLFMRTIEEIANDRGNAQDWSGKRVVHAKEGINYQTNYAQRNLMSYQDEADDPELGTGAFVLDNDTLQQQKTFYRSPFGNAKTAAYSGGNKALVNVYEGATTGITDFENEPGLRLLTLRAKGAGEGTITFNAVARSDYKVAYHVDALATKDTGFQYFIDQQYAQLAGALDEFKEPLHYYDLDQGDIRAFDKHRPMYDGGAYYIVLKIGTFIPGQLTPVTVMKLK